MRRITFKVAAVILACVISLSFTFTISGETSKPEKTAQTGKISDSSSYSDYVKAKDINYATENITVSADKFSLDGAVGKAQSYNGAQKAFLWENGVGSVTATQINVPQDGFYNIELRYSALKSGLNYEFGIKIDGEYPFESAKKITFLRFYKNKSEKYNVDSFGNEISPEQKEVDYFVSQKAIDKSGVVTEPYLFYFSKGTHTVSLIGYAQSIAIESIALVAPEQLSEYDKISKNYKFDNNSAKEIIYIQGEDAALKPASSIIPKSDKNSSLTPTSAYKNVINYIGGTTWQTPGQSLLWNFKVKNSGYYSFSFHYRQSDIVNAESWRKLKIDGKTPFSKANELRFPYSPRWSYYTLSEESNPCYVWLDEGDHTLSLEVTLGDMAEYYERLSDIVSMLGDEYIDIVKITGTTPDLNFDYELFNQIPDLGEVLNKSYTSLENLVNDLKGFTGSRGSQYIAAMQNMMRIIKRMVDSPYVAHEYVKDYYSNYATLSSWINDMKNMPIYLDEIQLVPYGKEYDNKTTGFFKGIKFTLSNLIGSFTEDYLPQNKTSDKPSLNLWVNWGQDQASVLSSLINDSFTTEHKIDVNLKITNAGLVKGILSGNAPDLAIYQSRTEPVNLGMRGALYNLKNFDDLNGVLSNFQKNADVPYRLGDALYALPDSQSFFLMFYRTDIFENLELTVPTTWEEFLHTSAIIQRNNMAVYVPYTMINSSTTVNVGLGNLNLYPTLMMQKGLPLYNEQLNKTTLGSTDSVNVFESWVKLYTDHEMQKEADFYNRFRVGIMPLGISTFATYMTLYSAAPEIQGRWAVACVPGTAGGENCVAGAGTGCSILSTSKNKPEAWEFLKWWTSADTQIRYSNNVESVLGMLGRPQTSNVEAFKSIPWDNDDLKVLLEQWSRVKEINEVPGSYYVIRALDQAFWSVINDGTNEKDALVKWSKVANAEIERKIEEYS